MRYSGPNARGQSMSSACFSFRCYSISSLFGIIPRHELPKLCCAIGGASFVVDPVSSVDPDKTLRLGLLYSSTQGIRRCSGLHKLGMPRRGAWRVFFSESVEQRRLWCVSRALFGVQLAGRAHVEHPSGHDQHQGAFGDMRRLLAYPYLL